MRYPHNHHHHYPTPYTVHNSVAVVVMVMVVEVMVSTTLEVVGPDTSHRTNCNSSFETLVRKTARCIGYLTGWYRIVKRTTYGITLCEKEIH